MAAQVLVATGARIDAEDAILRNLDVELNATAARWPSFALHSPAIVKNFRPG